MKICAISDLHGYLPVLESGDLLIIAGDCTARDELANWVDFFDWFRAQDYRKKILVGGNHDLFLQSIETSAQASILAKNEDFYEYLCNSGCEFEGYKIWGCPYTIQFPNQNPLAMAFCLIDEEKLQDIFNLVPEDTEILITHSPQFGCLDSCSRGRVGSRELGQRMYALKDLKLHVFGHIHEGYGVIDDERYISANCSHVNEYYKNVNKPVYFNLQNK